MTRKGFSVLAGIAAIAAGGLATAAAIAASGSAGQPAPATAAARAVYTAPGYSSWYRSVVSGFDGAGAGMMGGASYGWMMGGTAPASTALGTSPWFDMAKVMGSLFADAPGPRVSPVQAAALGSQVPAGARVSKAGDTITFTGMTVRVTIVASPPGGPDETFRAAGLVNPRIIVPAGARVSIDLINADPDSSHGLVITPGSASTSRMPMMTSGPAFSGSAWWMLGDPTSAGMHHGTLTFTATVPGTYRYLCPVPGHALQGMTGTFTVR